MLWGVLWRQENINGKHEHLCWDWKTNKVTPQLFRTRHEARQWAKENYGYMRRRKDLRVEPHGWKSPLIVKVTMTYEWHI